jgi:Zn-dependent peptidase ImmA (M78 family)
MVFKIHLACATKSHHRIPEPLPERTVRKNGADSRLNFAADTFASAFLMPRGAVLAQAPRFVTLAQLIKLKSVWTVSVSALAYRLHALDLLSDWLYRTLCIEISQRGFRKKEPAEARRESSQVLAKVFAALREEGLSKHEIARQLCVHPSELDQLAFGLMVMGMTETAAGAVAGAKRQVALRLVK